MAEDRGRFSVLTATIGGRHSPPPFFTPPTLATYTYTNDQNHYLEKLDYGNADSVEYEYNSHEDRGRFFVLPL